MHYLHPRSRTTGTLFTSTLAISFLVVALPHLLPCPADRRQFADSYETPDGRIMRRKKRTVDVDDDVVSSSQNPVDSADSTTTMAGRPKRECPLPKPGGIMGHMMGFKGQASPVTPTQVVVQSLDKRTLRTSYKENSDAP